MSNCDNILNNFTNDLYLNYKLKFKSIRLSKTTIESKSEWYLKIKNDISIDYNKPLYKYIL